ncbi:MAG: hypothetical protein IMY85_02845, partial [Chloroflexi bacterium]|nr:hypothetical protein [Chloroflexota bacterium]
LGSEQGTTDITVLGDAANIAARFSTNAGIGEILISEPAFSSAGVELGDLEKREIELKGKSEPLTAWVIPNRSNSS